MERARRPLGAALVLGSLMLAGFAPSVRAQETASIRASFRSGAAHHGVYLSRPLRHRPALRWKLATQGPVRSSPTLAGRLVLFGSADGNLYAADAASGTLAWKVATGGAVDSSPAVAGDAVYFASRDRKVYAVDLATGAPRWSAALGADLPFAWGYDYFLSSPVVDGDGVLVGGGDGALYRLSARTGAVQWRLATGAPIRSSPAVADGVAYVGGMDGRLYAVDARSGRRRWTFATDGVAIDLAKAGYDRRSIHSSPAVDSGVVTFGSRDNHLYGLDAATGRLLWKVPHPVERFPGHPEVSWVEGSPAVAAGVAYVGASDGRVVEARELATGRELWRFATPSIANASPALAGGVLYAGGGDGNLYAIDAATGRGLWRFPTGDAIYSSPAVAAGVVYVGSDDGALYALSDEDAAGHPVAERAVYYDDRAPGANYEDGKLLRDALAGAGYTVLDAAALAGFLGARAGDRGDRIPGVVVFASDVPPADVVDAPAGGSCLLRRYLEAGGRVVWVGVPPFLLKLDVARGKPARMEPGAMRRILGFGSDDLAAADGQLLRSTATADGLAWGLPAWAVYSFPVEARDVTTVLARDPAGRATAWVKTFGPAGEGAFVRFWGRDRALPSLAAVETIAEKLAAHGSGGL